MAMHLLHRGNAALVVFVSAWVFSLGAVDKNQTGPKVMAFYTDTIASRAGTTPASAIRNALSSFLSRIFEAQNRSVDVQRMQKLSDAELAKMGLNRDDIVRHVYRDIYYV